MGLTLGLVACATLASQKKAAPGVLVQDKGKFTIKLAGQTVGHEEFEIAPAEGGWLAKGSSDIKPPEGAPSRVTGSLTLLSNGAAAADGKTYEGLKVTSSDLEILLLLDNNHRLIRLEVPAAKVSVMRE